MIKFGFYSNNKTQDIYDVHTTVFNSTNAQNGQIMVCYRDKDGNEYVREIGEFKEKFKHVSAIH